MPPRQSRYQVERVPGPPELEALQDRLAPVLERLSQDADEGASAAEGAATAGGTAYTPADPAAWGDDPPSTVGDALDRIRAELGPAP